MIVWKRMEHRFANGENGWLNNKFKIFTVHWDGCRQKDDMETPPYALRCMLPGIKSYLGNFELDDAKEKAEQVLAYWLEKSGLEIKENS